MAVLKGPAWGKLTRNDSGELTGRLGLIEHCIDVAAVASALMRVPTIRRRLTKMARRPLTGVDFDRLAMIAFLHDVGKASSGFQSKCLLEGQRQSLLRKAGIRDMIDSGHTWVLAGLLKYPDTQQRLAESIPLFEIDDWGALDLWLASISHHGRPITFKALELCQVSESTWKRLEDYDPWQSLSELGRVARELFPAAFSVCVEPMPATPEFVHTYAGLVSLSDWIGSDCRPHTFPYDLGDDRDRWPLACKRATRLLREMCIDVEHIREDLRRRAPRFEDIFRDEKTNQPFTANSLQQHISASGLDQLVIAESETGSGKTEAALWRFKHLFERGDVDSIAFVLPTRVSAVQIEQRVRRFIEDLFPDQNCRPNVLLALPGYWRVDGVDAIGVLPRFEVRWPDEKEEENAHRRWAAENTKRYLAACCAIGSVDQVLLAGLQTSHSHLRGFALLRSLLVIDEVHASDAYMTTILGNVLRRHHNAGGHALLLSATLGLSARDGFLGRSDVRTGAETSIYPCISDRRRVIPLKPPERSKDVLVEMQPIIDDAPAVAEIVSNALKQHGRVLVIRNTVRGVIDVQQALEQSLGANHPALFGAGKGRIVCPHHGRYAAADRRILDAAVEKKFGKHSSDAPRVLVGSQTLEQSLDIDADLLITDLVPIDVLLQRVGRLHRHQQRAGRRPEAFRRARVVVLVPGTRDLLQYQKTAHNKHGFALDRAYENLPSVDATWDLLEAGRIVIPDENRKLVEFATDPEHLRQRVALLGPDWERYMDEAVGIDIARKQSGRSALCEWSDEWEESTFPHSDERVQTRLGIAAVRVDLKGAGPFKSPFGEKLTEIAIPRWMLPDSFDIEEISVEHVGGRFLIEVGNRQLSYDRFGLQ